MKQQIIKRLRNKAFLVALVSAIVLISQTLGLNILPKNFEAVINTILGLLVTMGIVIDPTTQGITDKTE